ncbi:potassium channel family protein [Halogeometricum sp. S1BR25-6]|uniref:Potassium channel family protein n=1 Tax=Halogeometricum salsisoli TaxID=2950536 RepID=A0ABU2GKG1_9EURY|nr:potassium channel family protein [Halogeometricum sp. S1BR25-6]MDS0301308.1 potassium channel family protein [Halogeometricum sp. S1BR25-6]
MSLLYAVLGLFVLLGTVVDLLWTTLWVEGGAGPLTDRLMRSIWCGLRRTADRHSRRLTLAGPLILVVSLSTWIVLLWLGWTLIFAGAENAVTEVNGPATVTWVERFYFTGYSLFTLGNGGFAPSGAVWQIVTVVMTASGMLFITLIVTYVLSILGVVTQKQQFASNVSGLGAYSEAVVEAGWNGSELDGFDLPIETITTELNELTVNHMAYPILHYFYTQRRQYSAVVSVAILDDSLTLLRFGVPPEHQPSTAVLKNARSSVENYLEMVSDTFAQSDGTPPEPDLNMLRENGIPTVSDEDFADALEEKQERRRRLHGLTDADARYWPRPENE